MTSTTASNIIYKADGLTSEQLKGIYKAILKPRMVEEKMLVLLRQGKISKWFAGIGQEAIAVGTTLAMQMEEHILPMIRNLGVFTTRQVPLERLFLQFQGKEGGFTQGRDRSFHFGAPEYNIAGMISHLGPQLSVANGVALANKIKEIGQVTAVFTGDGGTSQGEFHEALNVAAVWQLPVLFIIENNGYGLSTPSNEQFRCAHLADRGIGYGMESITIDGNNVLEVYKTMSRLAQDVRTNPRPILVECETFRVRGHEEASGVKYVPKELIEEWTAKDPVVNYENWLLAEGHITEAEIDTLRAAYKIEINDALEVAYGTPKVVPATPKELQERFAPATEAIIAPSEIKKEGRFIDAISDALKGSMERYDNLVLMGQDIAEYGGVFKITDGFVDQFGKERVRNTPLCESAILGAALGASMKGMKSMVEMQFADFVSCGFNQIVNNFAKIHYRWGQNADVVVRMPTGGTVAAGPFHSQSIEAWFFHTPGLKIVYPAFPQDAKGLLNAAIADPNPVMYFEHKALYRGLSGDISEEYFTTEIGKANVVKEGEEVSIITYGMGVHWALKALEAHPDIDGELVDLRSLLPYDEETILASVRKTGKAIVLHEATMTGGIGGEIAAFIGEHCFENLDAPVVRSASLDTPVPFAAELEDNFMPEKRFEAQLLELVAY